MTRTLRPTKRLAMMKEMEDAPPRSSWTTLWPTSGSSAAIAKTALTKSMVRLATRMANASGTIVQLTGVSGGGVEAGAGAADTTVAYSVSLSTPVLPYSWCRSSLLLLASEQQVWGLHNMHTPSCMTAKFSLKSPVFLTLLQVSQNLIALLPKHSHL